MKTLEDFQLLKSKSHGFSSVSDLINRASNIVMMAVLSEAAHKYSQYKAHEAFELGCNLTKEKCAEESQPKWLTDQNSEPWSFVDLFAKLLDGTRILLYEKDFDRLGWEEFEGCYRQGVQLLDKIRNEPPGNKPNCESPANPFTLKQ